MKEDFSELIEYLDKKFAKIENEARDFKNEMSNSFRGLQGSVDAYSEKADTYAQETTMLCHQVDRHEKWIEKAEIKVGIKLEH